MPRLAALREGQPNEKIRQECLMIDSFPKIAPRTAVSGSGLRARPVVKQRQIVLTLLFLFVLLSFFGFANSVSAQTTGIGLVQANAIEGSGVGSVSVTFPTGNTVGNLIIAFVRMSSTGQSVTVTDSVGNAYVDAVAQVQTMDGHQVHIFYAKNIVGGANTVKATFSATNNHPWLAIYEYRGLSTTNPLDQTASAQGSSATPNSGATATTVSANELLFAAIGLPSRYTGTVTAGSGYTMLQQDTNTSRAGNEAVAVTSTGAYAATFNVSPSTNRTAVLATFKPASVPVLTSLAVTPANPSVVKGTPQQFTAKGTYSDGTTADLTATATWSSSATTVATISATGAATTLTPGRTTITAAVGGVNGTTLLTVTATTPISIAVTPANPSVPIGTPQQFTATGTYSDGTTADLTPTATWSSLATTVATINATGLATTSNVGISTIQAALGTITGGTTLTVVSTTTVVVSPQAALVHVGSGNQLFTATVTNDAQNKGVTWTLSGAGCAGATCGTVSNSSSASGAAITYTPPVSAPTPATVTITATSVSDNTGSNSANISISTTPTGSTFTESFGDSLSLCWTGGPSSCDQLWVVAKGSAQAIVATPGTPPPNTASSNSLQMVETAGINSYLYTTGSFPRIPSGTAFDLHFTLDVSSQAMNAQDTTRLMTPSSLKDESQWPAQVSFRFDGTNLQLLAGGSTSASPINISLNSWHTVQLHVDTGTNASYIVVDGGAHNTFTENAIDFVDLVIGPASGNFDAMTYYIGNVYVDSPLGGGSSSSMYIDFENSVNGTTLTTDILAASTHCGNGVWSLTSNPITGMTISTDAQKQLHSTVTTCGKQYTDTTGTRGLRFDLSQTSRYAAYMWSTPSSSVSVGFYYKIGVTDTNYYSAFAITAGGGDYAVLHVRGGAMYIETWTGTTTPIKISPNTWYWATMQYNAVGN